MPRPMGSAAGEIQPGRGLNLVPRDVPAIRCHVERPSRPAGRSLSAAVIEGFVDQEGRRAVVHLAGGTAPTPPWRPSRQDKAASCNQMDTE